MALNAPRLYSKIYWPLQATCQDPGWVVGWNVSKTTMVVATVLPGVSLAIAEAAVKSLRVSPSKGPWWNILAGYTGGHPAVLGQWLGTAKSSRKWRRGPEEDSKGLWMVLGAAQGSSGTGSTVGGGGNGKGENHAHRRPRPRSRSRLDAIESRLEETLPVLLSMTSYGSSLGFRTVAQIILYARPPRGAFLTLNPMSLDMTTYEIPSPELLLPPSSRSLATSSASTLPSPVSTPHSATTPGSETPRFDRGLADELGERASTNASQNDPWLTGFQTAVGDGAGDLDQGRGEERGRGRGSEESGSRTSAALASSRSSSTSVLYPHGSSIGPSSSSAPQDCNSSEMELTLRQISHSGRVSALIAAAAAVLVSTDDPVSGSMSNIGRWIRVAFGRLQAGLTLMISFLFFQPFVLAAGVWRLLAEAIHVLSVRPVPGWMGGFALKELSFTIAQVDARTTALVGLPSLALNLSGRHSVWPDPPTRAGFVSAWNTVTMIIADILAGFVLGYLLLRYEPVIISNARGSVYEFQENILKANVEWLMGWPAGLKLNGPLNTFLGTFTLAAVDFWTVLLLYTLPVFPYMIRAIAALGVFGATFIVAAAADLATAAFFHVWSFYTMVSKAYSAQLRVVTALYRLFTGVKYNVLRHRVDSADVALDHLLLGALFGSIAALLFPTTAVYYAFFALVRGITLAWHAVVYCTLKLSNQVPIAGIVLHFIAPVWLPAGLQFQVLNTATPDLAQALSVKQPRWLASLRSSFLWSLLPRFLRSFLVFHAYSTAYKRVGTRSTLSARRYSSSKSGGSSLSFAPSAAAGASWGSRGSPPVGSTARSRAVSDTSVLRKRRGGGGRSSLDSSDPPLGSSAELFDQGGPSSSRSSILFLKGRSLGMSDIFFQFRQLARTLAAYYNPGRLIRAGLGGLSIESCPPVINPTIPQRRPSVLEFWLILRLWASGHIDLWNFHTGDVPEES